MRKFISGLIIGLMLATTASAFAGGQALRLIVNGEDITAQAQPVIIDGRTLVPARALAEKLGATVAWDGANNTVIVNSNLKDPAYPSQEKENTKYNLNEYFSLGDSVIKLQSVRYSDFMAGFVASPGNTFAIINFYVDYHGEPTDLFMYPNNFIASISVDGKKAQGNYHSTDKVGKGVNQNLVIFKEIPINSKITAVEFISPDNSFATPKNTATVKTN